MEELVRRVVDLVRQVVREELDARLAGTEDDPLLGAEQTAEHLHVSTQRVYDLVTQRKLERVGPKGTRLLIRRSELDRFVARRKAV
jgi:excisionase family DNA binding protein